MPLLIYVHCLSVHLHDKRRSYQGVKNNLPMEPNRKEKKKKNFSKLLAFTMQDNAGYLQDATPAPMDAGENNALDCYCYEVGYIDRKGNSSSA
jgi:hypothetical protein